MQAQDTEEILQGLWRFADLPMWKEEEHLQGVWRFWDLPMWKDKKRLQGVWKFEFLPTWKEEIQMSRMWLQVHLLQIQLGAEKRLSVQPLPPSRKAALQHQGGASSRGTESVGVGRGHITLHVVEQDQSGREQSSMRSLQARLCVGPSASGGDPRGR